MQKEFILIKETGIRGITKDRWECPICRSNHEPECRFNLDQKKRGSFHKCRFCKNKLLLKEN